MDEQGEFKHKKEEIPVIVLGSYEIIGVKLISSLTGFPFDVSAATEIEAIFLNADGTFLEKKKSLSGITVVNGPGGYIQIILLEAESALLAPSADFALSDIELHITIDSKTTILLMKQSVKIVPRLFPTAP